MTMLFCTNCGKHFKERRDLEKHNMRQNPCKIPSHFCPICNKGLNNRHTLCQHQKICSSSNHYNRGNLFSTESDPKNIYGVVGTNFASAHYCFTGHLPGVKAAGFYIGGKGGSVQIILFQRIILPRD